MDVKKLFMAFLAVLACACAEKNEQLQFIPQPQNVTMSAGFFTINEKTSVFTDLDNDEGMRLCQYALVSPLKTAISAKKDNNQIRLLLDVTLPEEAYALRVDKKMVEIRALSGAGFFYGLQTLLQSVEEKNGFQTIPCMQVDDSPRFPYRGMHLDVSRHFFDMDFIKKQLDIMAFYKLNRFHWHLTDGAGWRIEIKKYPRLTEFAAWRKGLWKEWWKGDRHYCEQGTDGAYGGFYTQEQIKEVVQYAAERYITVIPEIEMPGHAEEVLAAYPQLSCSGKPYTNGDFCIGNEETFTFLQNVLSEVMELFPSKQIHIGGDEAGKGAWKTCPKCQQRMKEEKLADVNELQSYLIHRIEKFLHDNNREMIGWNEIMEGGVSKDAIIMSWTGEEPGIRAVCQGNRTVMTPGGYCYFDTYQANPMTQPEAIGGYINTEKVYSFNPVPDSLTAEQKARILGVQSNLWTEYISTPEHVEYMIYPRLLALAEVAWTQPEHKLWDEFSKRVNVHIPLLRAKGVNAFELSDEPKIEQEMLLDEKKVRLTMSSERNPIEIRYTLNGSKTTSESTLYVNPLELDGAVLLTAALYKDGKRVGADVQKYYGFHKALGKLIIYNNAGYGKVYSGGGDNALVDGILGSFSYTDKRWQGFSLNDMDVTIDLGEKKEVNAVRATFMQLVGPWVWLPKQVEVLISDDNQNFISLTKIDNDIPTSQEGLILKNFGFEGKTSGRYIRYKAKTCGIEHGWMFVDEIVVL